MYEVEKDIAKLARSTDSVATGTPCKFRSVYEADEQSSRMARNHDLSLVQTYFCVARGQLMARYEAKVASIDAHAASIALRMVQASRCLQL